MIKYAILIFVLLISCTQTFSKNPKHYVEYYYKKLKKVEGYMLNGKKQGEWKYWNNEGDLEKVENWMNGELNGLCFLFKTSLLFNGTAKDQTNFTLLNYDYFIKRQNSDIKHDTLEYGNYTNGKKEGAWTFYGNGTYVDVWNSAKEKFTYVDGKKNGTGWRYRYGELDELLSYKNDFKYGPCTTYAYKGEIKRIENFVNDTLDGEFYDASNSYRIIRCSYNMGKLNGYYQALNQEEGYFEKGNYLNGKKEGEWIQRLKTYYSKNLLQMHTYHNDSLRGPYCEIHSVENAFNLLKTILPQKYEIGLYFTEFTNIHLLKIYGKYINSSLHTVEIFQGDSIPIAAFTTTGMDNVIGNYKLYKSGKIYFDGFFTQDKPDSTWTYYNEQGNISEIRKYRLEKYESDNYSDTFSIMYYSLKKYADGRKSAEFDRKKELKEIFYENGKLHALFNAAKLKNCNDCLSEKNYDESGRLCRTRIYDHNRNIVREYKVLPKFSDTLSIVDDDDFVGFFIPPPPPELVVAPEEIVEEVFTYVEETPAYPGGEYNLYKYLMEHCKFGRAPGGKMVVQFTVGKDGSLAHAKIVKDNVGFGNAIELSKTILDMPRWSPGKLNGRPVIMLYEITCDFRNQNHFEFNLELIDRDTEDENKK